MDDRLFRLPRRFHQSRAENRIDDQVPFPLWTFDLLKVPEHLETHRIDDLPINESLTFVFRWRRGEQEVHCRASVMKVSGNCQAVTTIVAGAANNDDLQVARQLPRHVRHAPRRILHQHDSRNVILLNRPPIDLPHLCSRQPSHVPHRFLDPNYLNFLPLCSWCLCDLCARIRSRFSRPLYSAVL